MASQVEQQYYAQLYAMADQDQDGKILGREGAPFLRKSNLSNVQLEKIWELVDQNKQGFLMQREFAYAMRLVAMAQAGKELKVEDIKNVTTLPKFEGIPVPVVFPSTMTAQELYKYDNLFSMADSNGDGFVDGGEAKVYFAKASISKEILAKIWEMSEMDKDNMLSRPEFRIMMHLIYWALKGESLPLSLPSSLIEQAKSAPPAATNVSLQTMQHPSQSMPAQPIQQQPPAPTTGFGNSSFPVASAPRQQPAQHSQMPQVPQHNIDAFSSALPSSNLVFIPAPANHNYEQSHFVAQHTLPGASFETRANFSAELNGALKSRANRAPTQ